MERKTVLQMWVEANQRIELVSPTLQGGFYGWIGADLPVVDASDQSSTHTD